MQKLEKTCLRTKPPSALLIHNCLEPLSACRNPTKPIVAHGNDHAEMRWPTPDAIAAIGHSLHQMRWPGSPPQNLFLHCPTPGSPGPHIPPHKLKTVKEHRPRFHPRTARYHVFNQSRTSQELKFRKLNCSLLFLLSFFFALKQVALCLYVMAVEVSTKYSIRVVITNAAILIRIIYLR